MTQAEEILKALLSGQSLTPLEALQNFGCFRLGARIWDLKQLGYDIKRENHQTADGKWVARYFIEQDEKNYIKIDVPKGTNLSLIF